MPTEPGQPAALFVFAHPDDEFFCLPVIRRELARGHRAICIYLTDGAYGGQSAQTRVAESTGVLAKVGVAESDIHFLGAQEGIPDGRLYLYLDLAYKHLCRFAKRHVLAGIYCPAWEGGHQDHDACYALCVSVAQAENAPTPFQFPLYNAYRPLLLFNVMHVLEPNGAADWISVSWKEAIGNLLTVGAYPSQWKTWIALFPFAAAHILRTRRYSLQQASTSRLLERPHEGRLLYEKRGLADFCEINRSLKAFRETIRPRSSQQPHTQN